MIQEKHIGFTGSDTVKKVVATVLNPSIRDLGNQ